MTNSIMGLGDFKFELIKNSIDGYSRSITYEWNEIKLIQGYPTLQFTGEGVETLSMSGVIYPLISGRKAIDTYEKLKGEAKQGIPRLLITGMGEVVGKFVVTSITESRQVLTKDALPKKIEFSIELKRFE